MVGGSSDRVLRGSGDEKLIQTVVERILASDTFINKIVAVMKETFEAQVKELKQELNAKVESLEKNISNLQIRCDSLEQYSRKNNVRIYGVPKTEAEDTYDTVVKLCNEKMGLDIVTADIDICHRLPGRNNRGDDPIIVKFVRGAAKERVLKSRSRLKGTKIIIREDLTRTRQGLVKTAIGVAGPKNVFTKNGVVHIKRNGRVHRISGENDLIDISFNN